MKSFFTTIVLLLLASTSLRSAAQVLYSQEKILTPVGMLSKETWIDQKKPPLLQLVIKGASYGIPLFDGIRLTGLDNLKLLDRDDNLIKTINYDSIIKFRHLGINWRIFVTKSNHAISSQIDENLFDIYLQQD